MKKTFVILDAARAALACEFIKRLPFDEIHKVVISLFRKNRSASQQGLQWMWNTDIGDFTGMTKEEAHDEMKGKFCVPILVRDDEEYAAMYVAIDALPESARKTVINMTSTTRLDVRQMAEYLTDMERHAAEFRIPLRHPDDYKYAMGKK